jgi:hypothetical protein
MGEKRCPTGKKLNPNAETYCRRNGRIFGLQALYIVLRSDGAVCYGPSTGKRTLDGAGHALDVGNMTTIILLTISNIFMTFAWYGHLKYRHAPLFKVIVISWLIAFLEYCFQVPANRIGSYEFSVAQLKTIQEVITLTVFSVFSVLYLGQPIRWNYVVGFAMMVLAVAVIFKKW